MKRCSGKAFFENGHSIGWDAIEDLGDDEKTAHQFITNRVLSQCMGTEKVTVVVKERLGAPVRSSFDFVLEGATGGRVLSQTPSV